MRSPRTTFRFLAFLSLSINVLEASAFMAANPRRCWQKTSESTGRALKSTDFDGTPVSSSTLQEIFVAGLTYQRMGDHAAAAKEYELFLDGAAEVGAPAE